MQYLAQVVQPFSLDDKTNLDRISFEVLRMPGWAKLCKGTKTFLRNDLGM